jgi:hypothetical protein
LTNQSAAPFGGIRMVRMTAMLHLRTLTRLQNPLFRPCFFASSVR